MIKNKFLKTGVVYYSPEMICFIESVTKEDNEGLKFKEILRYIFDLVTDTTANNYCLISDDEAKSLKELTLKYNEV